MWKSSLSKGTLFRFGIAVAGGIIGFYLLFLFSHRYALAQDSQISNFRVVRVYLEDAYLANTIMARFDPWEVHRDEGYMIIGLAPSEYDWLVSSGARFELDQAKTERLLAQAESLAAFPCYRSVQETFTTAQNLADQYPSLAEWVDVGDSWQKANSGGNTGHDLMVLKLTNAQFSISKPKLFVMSAIHAREYATAETNLRFAETLLENYGIDPDVTWLLDYTEIHLLLIANPDGREIAEMGVLWRKNTNKTYCTGSPDIGADLNRNFSFLWNVCQEGFCSSSDPCSEKYRGVSPKSEPETQAIENYLQAAFPDESQETMAYPGPEPNTTSGLLIDLHSYAKLVLWPWSSQHTSAPDRDALRTLGRKLAYFNDYYPLQFVDFYPADGTAIDFAYGELGIAAYIIELGDSFFQDCTTFEETIFPQNLQSLLYAAKVSGSPYITPSGPDTLEATLTPDRVVQGFPAVLTVKVDDKRFNNANGWEPYSLIKAAEFYLDVPPWIGSPSPTAYPMIPVDGSFNQTIEYASGIVNTLPLSPGRHIIFVRGQDLQGNWGAISAVFLEIEPGYQVFIPSILGP